MKIYKLLILLSTLATSQLIAKSYSFKVEVHGKGKPMLLIPGLNSDGSVWDATVAKYQKNYQLHVVTLPGFAGLKPMNLSKGFLKPLCAELLTYIEENKLKNPIIMGHSLGGFMSLLIAIKQPKLFSKIIIVDSVPFFAALQNPAATEENAKAMAKMTKKQMQSGTKEMLSAQLDMMMPSMTLSAEHIKLLKKWGMESDGATTAQAMYELMTTDLREKIAVIKSPIMLLGAWIAYKNYGATHQSVETNYRSQYSKVNDFQIYLTDVGKHFIMWDDPKFFYAKVDNFLK